MALREDGFAGAAPLTDSRRASARLSPEHSPRLRAAAGSAPADQRTPGSPTPGQRRASLTPSPQLRPLILASKSSSSVNLALPPAAPGSAAGGSRPNSTASAAPSQAESGSARLAPSRNSALGPAKGSPRLPQRQSLQTQDNASEQWSIPGDAEGALVRRAYAYFDEAGVSGDGFVEGDEFTRQKSSSYPWERPGQRASGSANASPSVGPRASQLGAGSVWRDGRLDAEGGSATARLASASAESSAQATAADAELERDRGERASRRSFTPATTPEPGASARDAAASTSAEAAAKQAAPETDEVYDELIGRIDRYGFFSSNVGSRIAQGRVVVLRSDAFKQLPKARKAPRPARGRASNTAGPAAEDDDDVGAAQRAADAGFAARGRREGEQRRKELGRIAKWERMMRAVPARGGQESATAFEFKPALSARKLRRRVFKGVPDRWRAAVWEALLRRRTAVDGQGKGKGKGRADTGAAFTRAALEASPHDVQIDLDVPRTISGHILFHTRYGLGQRGLFQVLHAFSLACGACAYCQGMGPIAATLLCYLLPAQAYGAMVALHDAYGLHATFSPGFPGLNEQFFVQRRLLLLFLPGVAAQLEAHGISTSSYATKWYITLFHGVVPFATQLRLWDAYLLEGPDTLVVAALAVLWGLRALLGSSACSFEAALGALSSFFVPQDDDALLGWIADVLDSQPARTAIAQARAQYARLDADGRAAEALL